MRTETENFADAWAAASAAAAAAEKGEKAPEAKPKAEPKTEAKADEATEASDEANDAAEPEDKPEAKTEKAAQSEGAEPAEAEEAEELDASDEKADRARAQLAKYAKQLGYKLEGETVSAEERVKFRAEKREARKAFQAEREAWELERGKFLERDADNGKKYQGLQAAIEAGDLDRIAELLDATSWNDLNQQLLIARSSPQAKEIAALKKAAKERDERDQKAATEKAQREQAAAQEAERKKYFADLSDEVDDAEDEQVRSLGKVAGFKEMILRAEQDGLERDQFGRWKTIERKEAIKTAFEQAKASYEQLRAVFGPKGEATEEDEKPAKASGKKPAAKPSGKSAGAKTVEMDTTTADGEKRWREHFEQMMRQANG